MHMCLNYKPTNLHMLKFACAASHCLHMLLQEHALACVQKLLSVFSLIPKTWLLNNGVHKSQNALNMRRPMSVQKMALRSCLMRLRAQNMVEKVQHPTWSSTHLFLRRSRCPCVHMFMSVYIYTCRCICRCVYINPHRCI